MANLFRRCVCHFLFATDKWNSRNLSCEIFDYFSKVTQQFPIQSINNLEKVCMEKAMKKSVVGFVVIRFTISHVTIKMSITIIKRRVDVTRDSVKLFHHQTDFDSSAPKMIHLTIILYE